MRPLLTAKEVGVLLNVKAVTVYAWAKQRKIPHVVLSIGDKGKECIRFRQRALEEWAEAHERPSNGWSKWDKR